MLSLVVVDSSEVLNIITAKNWYIYRGLGYGISK